MIGDSSLEFYTCGADRSGLHYLSCLLAPEIAPSRLMACFEYKARP